MSRGKRGYLSLCAFGSILLAVCLGRPLCAHHFKGIPKCIKALPIAEELASLNLKHLHMRS